MITPRNASSIPIIKYTRKTMEEPKKIVNSFYERQFKFFKFLGLFGLPSNYSRFCQILFKLYFWHVTVVWMLLFDISMWVKVIGNITDLNEIVNVFYICSMAIAVMAKFVHIRKKNSRYVAFFARMHNDDLLPANPSELRKFIKSVHLSCAVRNCYMGLSLTSLALVFVPKLISDPGELPLSIYIPLNVEHTLCFLVAYVFQFVGLSLCCFLNIAFDSLSASFFIYLKGQLDILSNRLENIGKFQNITQDVITLQLKECIRYYAKLRYITDIMEDLLCIPMSVQVISSVLVLVANFYAMTFVSYF